MRRPPVRPRTPRTSSSRCNTYCVGAEGGRELVFPGALLELPRGKGLLLIDQRRWTAQDESLARLAMRNVSSLMTALDVGMSSYIAPRELPRDLSFRTVDLSSAANFQIQAHAAPAKAGPVDLKGFPTGSGNFLNVPFVLPQAPNTCIAVASTLEPSVGNLPKEATVPLGFPAEGLYFLHAAANAGGGLVASYRIVYEDGGIFDVPVKGDVNVADWNALKVLSRRGRRLDRQQRRIPAHRRLQDALGESSARYADQGSRLCEPRDEVVPDPDRK